MIGVLQPKNPMMRVLLSVVIFEVIVFGLALPVMVMIDGVSWGLALATVVPAMVLATASAALLRRPIGMWLGWAAQVAGLLLGILTRGMLALGLVFALIWLTGFVLGRKLEDRPAQQGHSETR